MSKKNREFYRQNLTNFEIQIPWKYFVDILVKDYGFEMIRKSGSQRTFVVVKPQIIFTTHEDKFVHKGDRRKAIQAIEKLKVWKEVDRK